MSPKNENIPESKPDKKYQNFTTNLHSQVCSMPQTQSIAAKKEEALAISTLFFSY